METDRKHGGSRGRGAPIECSASSWTRSRRSWGARSRPIDRARAELEFNIHQADGRREKRDGRHSLCWTPSFGKSANSDSMARRTFSRASVAFSLLVSPLGFARASQSRGKRRADLAAGGNICCRCAAPMPGARLGLSAAILHELLLERVVDVDEQDLQVGQPRALQPEGDEYEEAL